MQPLSRYRRITQLAAAAGLFALTASGQVTFEKQEDRIAITIDGKPFSTLHFGKEVPKPFLAPVMSATGEQITRSYPMDKVEGESNDHQHHRGLWTGYGEINGLNFWENEFKYLSGAPKNFDPSKNGLIVLRNINSVKGGKKEGEIALTLDWVGADKSPILEEKRFMRFHAGNDRLRVVDFDFTLLAKQKADFADTKEGFFAIRLADSMIEKNGGVMTNSEGAQTEKNVWGKPANWVDYSGQVKGKKLGVAMFDHPGNFQHPTRWHSRAYGLFAANPYGLKDFDPGSLQKGGALMRPGEQVRFRYRIVIHPGDMTKKDIDELYSAYVK